ncbi:hypothetical protein BBOV_III004985 [Babesia bovis T2Bo]|uniref:hypothetical protein n=1 Tax=Babesia bovis T2Bo TaxID=484906 RepID=UPI001C355C20|nr:hypothetical protein BBOV_III004985 [Babesia bovis T2Bo]KAG6440044.1 hypothetical protein BBOV_III004985 [Babesia bovis T2Bo]
MGDQRLVFNAGIEAYVDDGAHRPPICKHSASCLSMYGNFHLLKNYYTLPYSCIQSGCRLDKWNLVSDKSHLQLQCGVSLQLVLNDMLGSGAITVHEYYDALSNFKEAVNINLPNIKNLPFSKKRSMPIKISGKLKNYKNEGKTWVFFLEKVYISIGKLTLSSPSMKVCVTK